jgi:glutamate synthase domain-containing protein 3
MKTIDLDISSVRELNACLHDHGADMPDEWRVLHPHGKHALAVGLQAAHKVSIEGHAGYYCGGMNKAAEITVKGQCGKGLGENIMSGVIRVEGNAAEAVGASGHGGMIVVEGDASSRCGISMKGVDIVVQGSVGHMSGFMAQAGNLVVCGDADDDLGDSIYEARIYVRGKTGALGADCVEKEMTPEHLETLAGLLKQAGMACGPDGFRRYGSARKLYNFDIDNAENY